MSRNISRGAWGTTRRLPVLKSERQLDMTVDRSAVRGFQHLHHPSYIHTHEEVVLPLPLVQLFAIHANKCFCGGGDEAPEITAVKCSTRKVAHNGDNNQEPGRRLRIRSREAAFDINPQDSRKKSKRRFNLIFYYS